MIRATKYPNESLSSLFCSDLCHTDELLTAGTTCDLLIIGFLSSFLFVALRCLVNTSSGGGENRNPDWARRGVALWCI